MAYALFRFSHNEKEMKLYKIFVLMPILIDNGYKYTIYFWVRRLFLRLFLAEEGSFILLPE